MLKHKETKRVDLGEICLVMGDMNAAINLSAKPYTKSAKNILDLEGTGKIRILKDKNEPTHVPYIKCHKKNCLDMIMITPGLEKKLKRYKLDIKREWTPAISVATGKGYGPDKVYTRDKPSDHKAQEVVIKLV